MSFITAIGTANPVHEIKQLAIAEFMIKAMQLSETEAKRLRSLYRVTGIATRYSVLSDYGKTDNFSFYPNDTSEPFPTTQKRMELYQQYAPLLAVEAAQNCLAKREMFDKKSITHVIVVSCTGLYAPGLDIDLIRLLNLRTSVERTAINFMGCYAAFNAIKLANTICLANAQANVLVVCVELCSIHFQKENTDDNLLANALFADGAAALLIQGQPQPGVSLQPLGFHCDLAFEGDQDMAWGVGNFGFEMRLSTYVPDIIRTGIKQLTQGLLQSLKLSQQDIQHYAIHPGGKKIVEAIAAELSLVKEDTQTAYRILERYGNMSSATVVFVLNELFTTYGATAANEKILSFAFGPGLTLESMVLQIYHE